MTHIHTWHSFISDTTHSYMTLIHTWHHTFIRDTTQSYMTLIHKWHHKIIRDTTHSYVTPHIHTWHHTFIHDTDSYVTPHIHTRHHSFIRDTHSYATPHIHTRHHTFIHDMKVVQFRRSTSFAVEISEKRPTNCSITTRAKCCELLQFFSSPTANLGLEFRAPNESLSSNSELRMSHWARNRSSEWVIELEFGAPNKSLEFFSSPTANLELEFGAPNESLKILFIRIRSSEFRAPKSSEWVISHIRAWIRSSEFGRREFSWSTKRVIGSVETKQLKSHVFGDTIKLHRPIDTTLSYQNRLLSHPNIIYRFIRLATMCCSSVLQ